MDKHTPGPWVVDPVLTYLVNRGEDGRRIAYLAPKDQVGNANLIATAPELLADLREAAATLRRYEALHRAKGTAESTAKAEVNAELASRFEATIAKATAA